MTPGKDVPEIEYKSFWDKVYKLEHRIPSIEGKAMEGHTLDLECDCVPTFFSHLKKVIHHVVH
jgi:hypothetical protein